MCVSTAWRPSGQYFKGTANDPEAVNARPNFFKAKALLTGGWVTCPGVTVSTRQFEDADASTATGAGVISWERSGAPCLIGYWREW